MLEFPGQGVYYREKAHTNIIVRSTFAGYKEA